MHLSWESLRPELRHVLLLASEEAQVWELSKPFDVFNDDGSTERFDGFSVMEGQSLLGELVSLELIAFYELALDNLIDLTADQSTEVISSHLGWEAGVSPTICVYLTPAGERIFSPDPTESRAASSD